MTKTIMNKLIASVAVATLFAPVLALAATTASLSPANVNVSTGRSPRGNFSQSAGYHDYAEKLEVDFSAIFWKRHRSPLEALGWR